MELFKEYKDVVTVKELCRMLGVGKNTAYKLLQDGCVKSVRIGSTYKISKHAVIKFLGNVQENA